MDLKLIKDPSFLKNCSTEDLVKLAETIRKFLIEKLSVTGGHLGPNLGVVELTISLHKMFDSPKDKIIWDVGHQSYVHKILTGRADQFDTLRQYKGLSGFPKRSESEHDVWETGHSSTSLSAAMGMAIARDLRGTDEHIVAVIGDGALTGGMALEALNHIGDEKKNLIVVLNDNEMSIAPNVGALHNALGRMRTAGKYNKVKDDIEYLMKKIPAFGGKIAAVAERVKDSFKYLLVPGMFFEELGFTYLGPVDGHNFDDLIENFKFAKKTKGPVLIHAVTKKGKGYFPAENDKVGTWHGLGPYKIDSGEVIKQKNAGPSYSKVVSDTLCKLAKEDERIVVITPAMIIGSKLEKFQELFPDRLFDVGIAEQHAVTLAGGLAVENMKPVVAIYSTFLQRGYDQLVHDICRQNLDVVFAVDRAGLVGADGDTHHGVFDINFMRHIPNLKILMAKDENELQHLIYTAVKHKGPIAVRFPRGNGIGVKMDEQLKEIPIGTWEVLRDGSDVALISFGPMLQEALKAADELETYGIYARVINARSIKPLDENMLIELSKEEIPIVTIEEAALEGGFGSAVLEFANSKKLPMYIERMGIPDEFIEHGSVSQLLKDIGLTKENIVELVKSINKKHLRALKNG